MWRVTPYRARTPISIGRDRGAPYGYSKLRCIERERYTEAHHIDRARPRRVCTARPACEPFLRGDPCHQVEGALPRHHRYRGTIAVATPSRPQQGFGAPPYCNVIQPRRGYKIPRYSIRSRATAYGAAQQRPRRPQLRRSWHMPPSRGRSNHPSATAQTLSRAFAPHRLPHPPV